jgi:hypothetical protein
MSLDPARIIFAASFRPMKLLDDPDEWCIGCMFMKERSEVCHKAEEEAKKRGLPSCESGHIYVAVKTDPRQLDIFG